LEVGDRSSRVRHQARRYDTTVAHALIPLWEASDRLCGKHLKTLLPVLYPALVRNGHLSPDALVDRSLAAISAATIDRLLRHERMAQLAARGGRRATVLRRKILPQMYSRQTYSVPGYLSIDLLAHCGERAVGPSVHSVRLVDLFSGWTESSPLLLREPSAMIACLEAMTKTLPMQLRGLVVGADLASFQEALRSFCADRQLTMSCEMHGDKPRKRLAGRSDLVVPPLSGSRRLEGVAAAEGLSRLYAVSGPYINFFSHSYVLGANAFNKQRSARPTRPDTPYARLLGTGALGKHDHIRLEETAQSLDPLQLLAQVRASQTHLRILAAGFVLQSRGRTRGEADVPGAGAGGKSQLQRHWRTHEDRFEAAWPTILAWRASNPDVSGKEVFDRLRREFPGVFREGQLRSLQRRLKQTRSRT
jgi:hypothetical protein